MVHNGLSEMETASLESVLERSYQVSHFNLREYPVDSLTGWDFLGLADATTQRLRFDHPGKASINVL